MRRFWLVGVVLAVLAVPAWATTADELLGYFEESQDWVKSAMVAFKVQKKASSEAVADMFEFVSDRSYDYEGLIIDGSEYGNGAGPMDPLVSTIGKGVVAVLHKLATDDDKKLFKPTWVGYHTPDDKRVSNWFCLIMGDHTKTYLTRIDPRAKLDEIGADPLQFNILDKNLFDFSIAKDLGNRVILKMTPKNQANTNVAEALIEMAKLQIGSVSTWYVTRVSGTLKNGTTGVTDYGDFRVVAAPAKEYVCWSEDGKLTGKYPVWGIGTALREQVAGDAKLYVFPTTIKSVSSQKGGQMGDYDVTLLTNIRRLHINPSPEAMLKHIRPDRLKTLVKVAKKVVSNH